MQWGALITPANMKALAAASSVEAVRLDYHTESQTLFVSIIRRGKARVDFIKVPTGRTLTVWEIRELLAGRSIDGGPGPGRLTPAELEASALHESPP
jgi:hypothetical protein